MVDKRDFKETTTMKVFEKGLWIVSGKDKKAYAMLNVPKEYAQDCFNKKAKLILMENGKTVIEKSGSVLHHKDGLATLRFKLPKRFRHKAKRKVKAEVRIAEHRIVVLADLSNIIVKS